MLTVDLMICNGADTNRFRDIAVNVTATVQHLFTYHLGSPVTIRNWDYRRDTPSVVPAGKMSARSLSMVERSECLLAILGPSVPTITAEEIVHAFEVRQAGRGIEFWLFLNPDQKTEEHHAFLEGIKNRFGEQIVYTEYRGELDFQLVALTTVFEYVTRQLLSRPATGVSAP